jgi:X-Pro dipeptidyl-peptidase
MRRILILLAFATPALAQTPKAAPIFENGMVQPNPAFADQSTWIRENLWIEIPYDTDRDGKNDRVHVDVTRPLQTQTEGLKVPVLYGSSPYYATTGAFVGFNVRVELNTPPIARPPHPGARVDQYNPTRTQISNALVNPWVSRGFAVAHSEATGSGRSQGCPTVGDGPERTAMKYVVDWLNGRVKGYKTPTGPEEVAPATWSTGKVGMMGTSYEGTLPLAAATTGVAGLEIVVPVAPNTSYYHYYRSNGLVRSPGGYLGEDVDALWDFINSGDPAGRPNCAKIWKDGLFADAKDRVTGDFNQFWLDRDLLPWVKNIKAKVVLVHGLNDYNVVPSHSVRIYDEMKRRGMNPTMYLSQGGHGGGVPPDQLNRLFSHYLYGINNGVEKDPPVWISLDAAAQSPAALAARAAAPPADAPAGGRGRGGATVAPTPFASFPVPGTQNVEFRPGTGGNGVGALSFSASRGSEKIVDDVAKSGSANAAAAQSPNRLLYATPVLTDTAHFSGVARITLRIAASKPAANLSVYLVMLPFDSASRGSSARVGLIARGWADIQNYKSLKGGDYASMNKGEKLEPGKFYDVTFDTEPADEFIPAGKQLAVMIMSSDREFTLWPQAGTELTVDLANSKFVIPIVGGKNALAAAGVK